MSIVMSESVRSSGSFVSPRMTDPRFSRFYDMSNQKAVFIAVSDE